MTIVTVCGGDSDDKRCQWHSDNSGNSAGSGNSDSGWVLSAKRLMCKRFEKCSVNSKFHEESISGLIGAAQPLSVVLISRECLAVLPLAWRNYTAARWVFILHIDLFFLEMCSVPVELFLELFTRICNMTPVNQFELETKIFFLASLKSWVLRLGHRFDSYLSDIFQETLRLEPLVVQLGIEQNGYLQRAF
jgi:hypothetical protein